MDIQKIILDLKSLSFPTYKYKQGNCHNLVHYCSLILKNRNIEHKKIWYYAPIRLDSNSKISISKSDDTGLAINNKLSWGYHVALLLETNNNNQIIDLMINEDEPICKPEWEKRMGLESYKIDIVEPENYLFFPKKEGERNIDKNYIQYFKYEGDCKENNWLQSALAINQTAYELYCNEKEKFEEASETSNDYKTLVGSIINFECVIRDQSFNNKVTPQLQANHIDLIEKYRHVYSQNLNKWISAVEHLDI